MQTTLRRTRCLVLTKQSLHYFTPLYKGHFAGIASTFNRDKQGDLIYPDAFNASISIWQTGTKKPPIYWEHNSDTQIGEIVLMKPTQYGLYIEGSIYSYFDFLINQLSEQKLGLSVRILITNYKITNTFGRFDIKKAFIIEISLTKNPIDSKAATFLNKKIR